MTGSQAIPLTHELYSLDKLIEETRLLAAQYHQTTGTPLPVTKEIARYDAMYHLKLAEPTQLEASVDALGTGEWAGEKIQIKGRVVFDSGRTGQRIGQLHWEGSWQRLVFVLLDADYQTQQIYAITKQTLEEVLNEESAGSSRALKRGAISVAKLKRLATLVWQK